MTLLAFDNNAWFILIITIDLFLTIRFLRQKKTDNRIFDYLLLKTSLMTTNTTYVKGLNCF